MNRILVIGIDGGTFDLVHPWAEAGEKFSTLTLPRVRAAAEKK